MPRAEDFCILMFLSSPAGKDKSEEAKFLSSVTGASISHFVSPSVCLSVCRSQFSASSVEYFPSHQNFLHKV